MQAMNDDSNSDDGSSLNVAERLDDSDQSDTEQEVIDENGLLLYLLSGCFCFVLAIVLYMQISSNSK